MSQCERGLPEGSAGEPDLFQTRASASAGAAGLGREGVVGLYLQLPSYCRVIETLGMGEFSFFAVIVTCSCVLSTGVGEEVPADCSLPQHEGDPNQEE